jgi:hypothetical protein
MARTGLYEKEAFHKAGAGANRPRVQRRIIRMRVAISRSKNKLPGGQPCTSRSSGDSMHLAGDCVEGTIYSPRKREVPGLRRHKATSEYQVPGSCLSC